MNDDDMTHDESLRLLQETLAAARERLATFSESSNKALLVARANALGQEVDAWRASPSEDVAQLLQRKINLLHVVLVKAARDWRRARP